MRDSREIAARHSSGVVGEAATDPRALLARLVSIHPVCLASQTFVAQEAWLMRWPGPTDAPLPTSSGRHQVSALKTSELAREKFESKRQGMKTTSRTAALSLAALLCSSLVVPSGFSRAVVRELYSEANSGLRSKTDFSTGGSIANTMKWVRHQNRCCSWCKLTRCRRA